jgi:phosphoenolpyruvate carboxylase
MQLFKLFKRVKPIFVVGFPMNINGEQVDSFHERLVKELKGYHVLAYRDSTIKAIKFECFNCEINEIEFNELKEKLYKTIINNESNFRI